jgi:hypothetical protein
VRVSLRLAAAEIVSAVGSVGLAGVLERLDRSQPTANTNDSSTSPSVVKRRDIFMEVTLEEEQVLSKDEGNIATFAPDKAAIVYYLLPAPKLSISPLPLPQSIIYGNLTNLPYFLSIGTTNQQQLRSVSDKWLMVQIWRKHLIRALQCNVPTNENSRFRTLPKR